MPRDYKYEMQMLAEEEAEKQHGKDFSSLRPEQQFEIYKKAHTDWVDNKLSREPLEDR